MDTEHEARDLMVNVLMNEVPMLSRFAAEAITAVMVTALAHHGLLREDTDV